MINKMLESILNTDRAPIVVCNLEHTVVYMNPAAIRRYEKQGGKSLIGKSLLCCHNSKSCEIIHNILSWFSESNKNNMIFTSRNEEENKDVYMVALRDAEDNLIGYYEKHEYRNKEKAELYDYSKSLI